MILKESQMEETEERKQTNEENQDSLLKKEPSKILEVSEIETLENEEKKTETDSNNTPDPLNQKCIFGELGNFYIVYI